MAITVSFAAFDSGLYLLGGREVIPPNATRVFTGANPVHARSVRSRNANVRVNTAAAISAIHFNGQHVTVDNSGNLLFNFGVVKSGVAVGKRMSFSKAPPHFGSSSYLFAIGGGVAGKIDESGNYTNWGLAAPTGTPAAVALATTPAAFLLIDNLNTDPALNANISAIFSGTVAFDNANFVINSGSTKISIPPRSTGGIQEAPQGLNLAPFTSTNFDAIEFYIRIDQPQLLRDLTVQFDVASNFTTQMYTAQVPLYPVTGPAQPNGTLDVADLDAVATSFLNGGSWPSGVGNRMQQEFAQAFLQFLNGRQSGLPANFSPTAAALALQATNGITIAAAGGNWWIVRIPKAAFIQVGAAKDTNNWPNVTGWQIFGTNQSASSTVNFWLNGLMLGNAVQPNAVSPGSGFGLLGAYNWYYTFTNSKTGSYSNPATAVTALSQVDRNAVNLTNLPTNSPDAQVDTLTIWRTLGNGGIPYRLIDIPLAGFGGSFLDVISDYAGFGPTPSALSDWAASTSYPVGAMILPSNNPGNFCFVSTATTSNAASDLTPPVWPQKPGATVADTSGKITWQNVGKTLLLSLEPLVLVNTLPPLTASQCAFWKGTMFICADSAPGARGRIYYSAAGYTEGVAGYTDISNDDDPTIGFGLYANNLYVLTTKGLWQIIDISTGPYQPGFTAVQIGTAPGCGSAQSIVATPVGLVYQSPEFDLHVFDGYITANLAGQILPILNGDTIEGYAAVGQIVAATFGRDEYWFSDGVNNLFAINIMPNSIPTDTGAINMVTRCHGTAATAINYSYSPPEVLAGWNGGTYHLEVAGHYAKDDGTNTLPFQLRTPSFYTGEKYTGKGQRVIVDVNDGGNLISVFVSVDGTDYLLGTTDGAGKRAKYEFPYNIVGSLFGGYLTTVGGNGQIEVFRIALEVDASGADDVGTGGGPGQQLASALSEIAAQSQTR
jgi:hypothetical protein